MKALTLGGPTAWKVYARDDLVVAFHWVNDEPAMFIYPRYRRLRLKESVPWCLPLPAAHELVDHGTKGAGVNTVELLAKAKRCAWVMGVDDDMQMVFRIADTILAGLDDLIRMPPTPQFLLKQQDALPGAVMRMRVGDKVVNEREL